MKELTIEEKAQRYDETIERAKKWRNAPNADKIPTYASRVVNEIFPELAESEDERIRKGLIQYFNDFNLDTFAGLDPKKILAWLEKQGEFKSSKWTEGDVVRHGGVLALVTNGRNAMKSNCEQITIQYPDEWVKAEKKERRYFFEELEKQGEQKQDPCEHCNDMYLNCHHFPCIKKRAFEQGKSVWEIINEEKVDNANKVVVEPKFKVGDWITDGEKVWKIGYIEDDTYIEHCGLISAGGFIESIDKHYHLWSIKDAKDGDVLAISWWEDNNFWENIIIFKKYHNKGVKGLYCMPCVEGYGNTFKNGKLAFNDKVPYYSKTWTCNLHPTTKEQRDLLFQKMKEAGFEWDAEKKEPKRIENVEIPFSAKDSELQEATYFIPKGFYAEIKGDSVFIKKGEKPTAWSEEDETGWTNTMIMIKEVASNHYTKDSIKLVVNFLKSIKERYTWNPTDEEMVEALRTEYEKGRADAIAEMQKEWSEEDEKKLNYLIAFLQNSTMTNNALSATNEGIEDWLKSLKDRVQSKSQWKPSEEQMNDLKNAINSFTFENDYLQELYEDLKKLR